MLHADGKVITPLFKAKPGDQRLDRRTGELLPTRYEPDAALHFEGDGNAAWGTKFVLVAARTDRRARPHHPRRRMGPHPRRRSPQRRRLLHPSRTPHPRRARRHLRHRAPRCPPPAPAARTRTAPDQPRHRRQGRRQEAPPQRRDASRRTSTSKTRPSRSPTARPQRSSLYASGGALGIAELTDTGDPALRAARPHPHPPQPRQERPVPLVQRLPASRPLRATRRSPCASTATTKTTPGS